MHWSLIVGMFLVACLIVLYVAYKNRQQDKSRIVREETTTTKLDEIVKTGDLVHRLAVLKEKETMMLIAREKADTSKDPKDVASAAAAEADYLAYKKASPEQMQSKNVVVQQVVQEQVVVRQVTPP